jgi:hypothetical protein
MQGNLGAWRQRPETPNKRGQKAIDDRTEVTDIEPANFAQSRRICPLGCDARLNEDLSRFRKQRRPSSSQLDPS